MSRILVWDLPTRIFHWLFAIVMAISFCIAFIADDDSSLFSAHMILGLVLALMVFLRVVWGFFGTKYARLTSFLFRPSAVASYLRIALLGPGERYIGHNPGSSYAIFAMFGLVVLVVATGLLVSSGSEALEDLHELASYVLLAVIVVHIAGVIFFTVKQRENISWSMVTGFKEGIQEQAIASSRPLVAGVFVLLVGWFSVKLFRNYDPTTGQIALPILGTVLQLDVEEDDDD